MVCANAIVRIPDAIIAAETWMTSHTDFSAGTNTSWVGSA